MVSTGIATAPSHSFPKSGSSLIIASTVAYQRWTPKGMQTPDDFRAVPPFESLNGFYDLNYPMRLTGVH